jgi:hypothetical protein
MRDLWKLIFVAVLVTAILSGESFGAKLPAQPVVQKTPMGEQAAQKQNYMVCIFNLTSRPMYLVTESGQRYDITWNENLGSVEGNPAYSPIALFHDLGGLGYCYLKCSGKTGADYGKCVKDCVGEVYGPTPQKPAGPGTI